MSELDTTKGEIERRLRSVKEGLKWDHYEHEDILLWLLEIIDEITDQND